MTFHDMSHLQGFFSISFSGDEGKTFMEVAKVPDMGEPSLHLYSANVKLPALSAGHHQIMQVRYGWNLLYQWRLSMGRALPFQSRKWSPSPLLFPMKQRTLPRSEKLEYLGNYFQHPFAKFRSKLNKNFFHSERKKLIFNQEISFQYFRFVSR